MITIKNKISIAKMEKAGILLQEIFDALDPFIKQGISTLDIDSKIAELLKERKHDFKNAWLSWISSM